MWLEVGQSPIKSGWRDAPLALGNLVEAVNIDHTKMATDTYFEINDVTGGDQV